MITLGIDCGNQSTKAVLLKDNKILAYAKTPTDFDVQQAADEVISQVLKKGNLSFEDLDASAVTGAGKNLVEQIPVKLNEVSSASLGASFVVPSAEIIIDLGAESSRAIRLDENHAIADYSSNDKCASGSGTFIETMARTLQIGTEEMGSYSLRHTKDISLVAQCVVFAESEVISLVHEQESVENIVYGIHSGIANRVAGLVRHVGTADQAVLIGGPGLNAGLVDCLEKETKMKMFVPEHVEFISALGAAVHASRN